MIIKLGKNQIDLLIRSAQKKYPIEACGVLFGIMHGKKAYVKKIVLLRNLLNSENRFQIDPSEFLKTLLNAEREGLQHIGFFHSHPLNVAPSAVDLQYMKLWPETVWLIISPLNRKIAAYCMINGQLNKVSVEDEN